MDIKNKLVVTSGEREKRKGKIGVGEKRIIVGLYKIMYVKYLTIIKHYRILRIFHSKKNNIFSFKIWPNFKINK